MNKWMSEQEKLGVTIGNCRENHKQNTRTTEHRRMCAAQRERNRRPRRRNAELSVKAKEGREKYIVVLFLIGLSPDNSKEQS
jgi:hypothetical protein